jgi:hypothetical protein
VGYRIPATETHAAAWTNSVGGIRVRLRSFAARLPKTALTRQQERCQAHSWQGWRTLTAR